MANFNIATNEIWTDKAGEKKERTEWHKIVVWGKQAETCQEYLTKGRQVYIEGRLQTQKWQDQQGQARYTTEVVAERVQFLGGQPGAGLSSGGASQQRNNNYLPSGSEDSSSLQEPTFTEEDIPF